MKFSTGDYLIIRQGNKNLFVRAISQTIAQLNTSADEQVKFDSTTDVVCVLGKDLQIGSSAFGVKIEPFSTSLAFSNFPDTFIYGTAKVTKRIQRGIRKFLSLVPKYKIHEAVRRSKTVNFIQAEKVKASKYSPKFKRDEWQDQITVYFVEKDCTSDSICESLLSAYGHSVYQHLLTPKRKAKWILAHRKLRNVHKLTRKDLSQVLEQFITEADIKDVKNVLPDNIYPFSDSLFRSIARQHSLTTKDLELLAAADAETLADLWPTAIEIAEGRPDLDRSIMRSPQILFASVLIKYHNKTSVGKTLDLLVKRTLRDLKV